MFEQTLVCHCWDGVSITFGGGLREKVAKIFRNGAGYRTLKIAESAVLRSREYSATVRMGSPSYSVAI